MESTNTESQSTEVIAQTLAEELKPYRAEWKRRERVNRFVDQCIRAARREDFFGLAELLGQKIAKEIEQESGLGTTVQLVKQLRAYADRQIELYRVDFVSELESAAAEAELPLTLDFPRFTFAPGIDGEVDFAHRVTLFNQKKRLKSLDPRRIVATAQILQKKLYVAKFDAQQFIDDLFASYERELGKQAEGSPVNIQVVYRAYVLGLQSKAFFQNMEKGRFREYGVDRFAVELWRYFGADVEGTSKGHVVRLSPGRSNTLWLIDRDGERRQIASISFQKSSKSKSKRKGGKK